MRLYVTPSGRWAGTQADAATVAREADAGRWQHFEVPTDKAGLLAFLDERRVGAAAEPQLRDDGIVPTGSTFDTPPVAPPLAPTPVAVGTAVALTTVEEFIQNADAGQLARCADNVCWRIKELIGQVTR